MPRLTSCIVALALSIPAISPVFAADPFYIGNWKFDSAVVAPWADHAATPDAAEKKALMGKIVSIKPKAITGPNTFACSKPHYKVVNYPADMLFQGAFGEMQSRDKSIDPVKLAQSVGFTGTSWQTLETGCEFDWHFVNPTTVDIGLNDYVYTLKKQ